MKRHPLLLFAVLVTLLPIVTQAQSVPPSIEQVLSRYVQAIGGRENILKITNRSMSGTFQMDGADRGTVEVLYQLPNLYHSIVSVEGYGVIDTGHDAAGGWEKSPGQPPQAQSGAELAAAVANWICTRR